MAEFTVENAQLDIPQTPQNGDVFKNVKELKAGNGNFYVDASGKITLRDTSGNIVVLIDPNG